MEDFGSALFFFFFSLLSWGKGKNSEWAFNQ